MSPVASLLSDMQTWQTNSNSVIFYLRPIVIKNPEKTAAWVVVEGKQHVVWKATIMLTNAKSMQCGRQRNSIERLSCISTNNLRALIISSYPINNNRKHKSLTSVVCVALYLKKVHDFYAILRLLFLLHYHLIESLLYSMQGLNVKNKRTLFHCTLQSFRNIILPLNQNLQNSYVHEDS